jgi:CheY-like chemotaxis protein
LKGPGLLDLVSPKKIRTEKIIFLRKSCLLERLNKRKDSIPCESQLEVRKIERREMEKSEILIIDDDIIAQNMLRTTLTGAGYSVLVASSGQEGLAKAKEMRPKLIVLDIMMPGLDGGEVANLLKEDRMTREIPIIFLSSLVSEREEKIGSRKDLSAVLSKPYSRDKLLNEVSKYFH